LGVSTKGKRRSNGKGKRYNRGENRGGPAREILRPRVVEKNEESVGVPKK